MQGGSHLYTRYWLAKLSVPTLTDRLATFYCYRHIRMRDTFSDLQGRD